MPLPSSNTVGCVYGSRQNTDNVEIPGTLAVTGVLTATGGVAGAVTGAVSATSVSVTGGGDVTLSAASDVVLDATTGTKIGTATTQKLGFYNSTPVVQPTAYTQTFATADKTHAARTAAAVVTTAATNVAPYGYSQAQADAIVTAINAVQVDLADTAQLLNSLIDDLQALGLVG